MVRQTKKDHRTSSLTRKQGTRNVKQSFLIVCEGVRTEPDYFKAFRMTTATVKAIGQAMNTISLVNKAISIRDTEQKNGFRVAYSNQAFEYWFLLHFNLYRGPLHRQNYADMLSKLIGMPYSKSEGFGAVMYNRLYHLQSQAIKNANVVFNEVSNGNPAMEESSTTVHLLVEELNKYV